MKRLFFIMSMLIYCSQLYGQHGNDLNLMIDSAIVMKYKLLQNAAKAGGNKDYLENLYLINEQNQPLNYISSSSKFKAISVYDDRNKKIFKRGVYAWKVFTNLNKNQFLISIINFYITYKDHNYNFANSGVSKTIFEYDCDKKCWRLIDFKNNGN